MERDADVGGAERGLVVGQREPRGEDGNVSERVLVQQRAVHLLLRPAARDDDEEVAQRPAVRARTLPRSRDSVVVRAQGVEEDAKVLVGGPAGARDEDGDGALRGGCGSLGLGDARAHDRALRVRREVRGAVRELVAEESGEERPALRGRERAERGGGLVVEDADGDAAGDAPPGAAEVRGERVRDGEVRVGAARAKDALERGVRAHERVCGAEREREQRVAEVVPVDDVHRSRQPRGRPRERERRQRRRVLHEDVCCGPCAHRERPEEARALRGDFCGCVEDKECAAQGARHARGERGEGRHQHEAHAVGAQRRERGRRRRAAARDDVHVRDARGLLRETECVVAHARAVAHVPQHHHRHRRQPAPPLRRHRAPPPPKVPHAHRSGKAKQTQENSS